MRRHVSALAVGYLQGGGIRFLSTCS